MEQACKSVMVISPHPDDETLGCGGALLRHIANGDMVYWLIITALHQDLGVSITREAEREAEIRAVKEAYGFRDLFNLGLPTTRLDVLPMSDIVNAIGRIFTRVKPEIIYLPHGGDVHTDHRIVFNAASSCMKWFRFPSIRRALSYETLSETEFTTHQDYRIFKPVVFVDISAYLERKIEIMNIYKSEVGEHPFPRSDKAIRSLAFVRGATSGYPAAEAFVLLRERY
jgi:LmbE family N-acetylglucosaminyl deacetylase